MKMKLILYSMFALAVLVPSALMAEDTSQISTESAKPSGVTAAPLSDITPQAHKPETEIVDPSDIPAPSVNRPSDIPATGTAKPPLPAGDISLEPPPVQSVGASSAVGSDTPSAIPAPSADKPPEIRVIPPQPPPPTHSVEAPQLNSDITMEFNVPTESVGATPPVAATPSAILDGGEAEAPPGSFQLGQPPEWVGTVANIGGQIEESIPKPITGRIPEAVRGGGKMLGWMDQAGNIGSVLGAYAGGDETDIAEEGANALLAGGSAAAGGYLGGLALGQLGFWAGGAIGSAFGGIGMIPGAIVGGIVGEGVGMVLGALGGTLAYDAYGKPVVANVADGYREEAVEQRLTEMRQRVEEARRQEEARQQELAAATAAASQGSLVGSGLITEEPELGSAPASAVSGGGTALADEYVSGTQTHSTENTEAGITLAQLTGNIQAGSTAGDSTLNAANQQVNEAGSQAGDDRRGAVAQMASAQASETVGQTAANAFEEAITEGVSGFGTSFGTTVATNIITRVFPTKPSDSSGSGGDTGGGQSSVDTASVSATATSDGTASGSGDGTSGGGDSGGSGSGDTGDAGGSATGASDGSSTGSSSGGTNDGSSVTITTSASAGDGTASAGSSGSGGYAPGAQDKVIDASSQLGGKTVTGVKASVSYQAYSIPDQFQIIYNGSKVADSGMVSYSGTTSGQASGSSTKVTIRVISNQDQGTQWTWSADVTFLTGGSSGAGLPSR